MSVHYSPGTHPVAVTPQGFAALADDTSPALAARIHALVADGRGLGGVLEALTGAYGTSLSAVPPFAVALAEGGSVRLAVRGSFALDVDGRTPERVSGEGVTTWTERVIAEASRVSLDGGADAAPPELPVADGVVLAGALVWVPSGAGEAGVVKAEAAAAAAAAESPEPVPAPEADPDPEPTPAPEADPDPEPEPEVASTPSAQSEREPGPHRRATNFRERRCGTGQVERLVRRNFVSASSSRLKSSSGSRFGFPVNRRPFFCRSAASGPIALGAIMSRAPLSNAATSAASSG